MHYNNCLKDNNLDKTLTETCSFIYNILSEHCGPLCEYAFIKDVKDPSDDGNFTKDGINIVRSLEFNTPIQNALKTTIAHIGSSVERIAADGTTSSMMIAIHVLNSLRNNKLVRNVPTSVFVEAWKHFEYMLQAEYRKNDIVINLEDLYDKASRECKSQTFCRRIYRELIRGIAYSQTYTSSHGDTEFANKVADLFVGVPKDAWKTITVRRAEFETDTQYDIECDSSEWTFNKVGIIPFNERLGENIDGKLIRNDQKCVFSTITPLYGGGIDNQELLAKIHKSIESSEDITYIVPANIDAHSRNSIDQKFYDNPTSKTTIIFVIPEKDGLPSELEIMPLLIDGYKGEPTYELTCSYNSNGKHLKIEKGIHQFEHSETCMVHPWLHDSAHKLYNEYVGKLSTNLANAENDFDRSEINKAWYENTRKLLNKLTIINRVNFVVGGSLYNNLTAIDIVNDTLPAVKRSLENGFCLGGNKSLYNAILNVINKRKKEVCSSGNQEYFIQQTDLINAICLAFMDAIKDLDKCIVQYKNKSWTDKMKYSFDPNSTTNVITGRTLGVNQLQDIGIKYYDAIIMQPIKTDLELIKRFGEMVIRFIKTNKMITVGTMVTDNTK